MFSKEKYLLDTNVLLYSLDKASYSHKAILDAICEGQNEGADFVIAHQNLVELVSVLTRGYKVPIRSAVKDALDFALYFGIIHPLSTTFLRCLNMLEKGQRNIYPFDCYLTATMLDNGVSRIVTGDRKDFQGLGLDEIVEI